MAFEVTLTSGWVEHLNAPIADLLDRVGKGIVADAKRTVPVLSGDLRDSITSEVRDKELVVSADTDYARIVELGDPDRNYPAQPYLKPALYRARGLSG